MPMTFDVPVSSLLPHLQVYKVVLDGVQYHAAKVLRLGEDERLQDAFLQVRLAERGYYWLAAWLAAWLTH